jgi:hypothetical protein
MKNIYRKRRNPNSIGKRKYLIEKEDNKFWENEIDSVDYTHSGTEDNDYNNNSGSSHGNKN